MQHLTQYTLLYLQWITSKELCSMFCGSLDGRGVWVRMDTCICMTESLETITALLIGYTGIQNEKLKRKKRVINQQNNKIKCKCFIK